MFDKAGIARLDCQSRFKYGEMVELDEGTGLENRRGCKPSAGSNPALSAIFQKGSLVLGIAVHQ